MKRIKGLEDLKVLIIDTQGIFIRMCIVWFRVVD